MSVIEDSRKLIQDFLAPELREIATRLDALEKNFGIRCDAQEKLFNLRLDGQEQRFNSRFDGQEERTADRFAAVNAQLDTAERLASERHAQIWQQFQQLADVSELKVRLAVVEAQTKTN